MRYSFIFFFSTICSLLHSQELYELEQIQTIEITFEQSNWDQILDIAYDSGEYTLAQSVSINGTVFDSVGVKYKGNSTYQANQVKNPFHIELDTYKDHIYENYTDIKLSNVAKDPSFLREVLSYQIIRQYMDAPLSNYANVYVNGELIGLYSNSEAISKKFVNDRFGSKNNTFIKCNPPAGAGPQSNDFPNLVYLGEDSTNYYEAYELKSDFGWSELIDLCDTLSNHTEDIEQILDVDRALWMLALNNVMVNLDSYIGSFAQNYYLYRDDNGRFVPVIWDLNESFGRFTNTGSGNLNNTLSKQQMSPWLHENDSDFPLIQKLLAVPSYRRMYLAHYKTILLENFEDGSYFSSGEVFQDLINESVANDDNKFFTYNNFLSNLSTDIGGGGGPGGGNTVGIANLMDGRTSYLLGLSEFMQTEPEISNISFSTDDIVVGETFSLTASIADASKVYLGTRANRQDVFQKIEMFDDGMHNDGSAGDGIYGVDFIVEQTLIQFFIYAENDNAGKFSPERAEYEYHLITASTEIQEAGDLVINEFMASNDFTASDQDGEFDDWIELYNNTSNPIDLTGYFLSDNLDNLTKWPFPEGTMIDGSGYLIIWSDEDGGQEGLHSNFKISASGESIFLVDPLENIIDEISFGVQETDLTYGRLPNGTGNFQVLDPTFNAENTGTVSTANVLSQFSFEMYPNPSSTKIWIDSNQKLYKCLIYNSSGRLVFDKEFSDQSKSLNIEDFQNGIYFLKVFNEESKYLSKSFVKIN